MKKKAKRQIIVTDMGNGGQYCSNCMTNVTYDDEHCPCCKLFLEEGSIGGDFGNYDPNRY